MRIFITVCITIFLFSCTAQKNVTSNDDLSNLVKMMTGTFNSSAQANADSNYYDITLNMYPIWTERSGNWLYVEQAITQGLERPYRQRIYKVEYKEGLYISSVYTLPSPKDYIGAYKTPKKFDALTFEELSEREGCAVIMKKLSNGNFQGETGANSCGSTLRGAAYATSEVEILPNKIVSWDRGFFEDGKQAWGATKAGYIFDRID